MDPLTAREAPIRLFTLPNLLSLLSLNLGAWSILYAVTHPERLAPAAVALLVAVVCDVADGRVARATGTGSALGVQLDSLADLVSFGVAPAALLWAGGLSRLGLPGLLACGAFASCAALRLARFNVRAAEGPKTHFEGLPTTGAAALVVLAVLSGTGPLLALALALALAGMMISDLKFLTLKVRFPLRVAIAGLLLAGGLALAAGPTAALLAMYAAWLGWAVWENGAEMARRMREAHR